MVKKGSKARAATSSLIPVPVSVTRSDTRCASTSVDTVSRPPPGMASRALTTRLTRICSSWPAGIFVAFRGAEDDTPDHAIRGSDRTAPSDLLESVAGIPEGIQTIESGVAGFDRRERRSVDVPAVRRERHPVLGQRKRARRGIFLKRGTGRN